MSQPGTFHHIEAFIEEGQRGHDETGKPCQLVTVMLTDEDCRLEPAVGVLSAEQARGIAFELLAAAEHADRLTPQQGSER